MCTIHTDLFLTQTDIKEMHATLITSEKILLHVRVYARDTARRISIKFAVIRVVF